MGGVEIEDLVHDLGVWHLFTLNSPSTSMLELKVLVIKNNLEYLRWEYDDLLADDEHGQRMLETEEHNTKYYENGIAQHKPLSDI